MLEVLLALMVVAAIGWSRPRWSSLWISAVPTALALAWLLLHEDVPGDPVGPGDIAWYLAMSLAVGAAFALTCLLGIAARRALARRRTRPLL